MIINNRHIYKSDPELVKRGKCERLFNVIVNLCNTKQQNDKKFSNTDPTLECSYYIHQFNEYCTNYKIKKGENDFFYKIENPKLLKKIIT